MSSKLVVCCGDIKIFRIFKMAGAAILYFRNSKILLVIGVESVEIHQHAKLCQNRSIGCEDIKIFSVLRDGGRRHLGLSNSQNFICWRYPEGTDASLCQILSKSVDRLQNDIKIFRFFKMATAVILDFRNRIFLFAAGICGAQTHHCNKFRQNCSFHCWDIAIFQIFKMAAAAILNFWNREMLLVTRVQRVETHQHAKFCQNQSIGSEDIKIFSSFQIKIHDFENTMAVAAILCFRNREFLFGVSISSAQTHHWSNRLRRY